MPCLPCSAHAQFIINIHGLTIIFVLPLALEISRYVDLSLVQCCILAVMKFKTMKFNFEDIHLVL